MRRIGDTFLGIQPKVAQFLDAVARFGPRSTPATRIALGSAALTALALEFVLIRAWGLRATRPLKASVNT